MKRVRNAAAIAAATTALLLTWEGLRTKPYYDTVGVLTVCVGETKNVKPTDVYTAAECKAMLRRRQDVFEAGVYKCLKNPEAVPAGAYVASISMAYNLGVSAYCGSSVRRKLDAGDVRGACDAILLYKNAGGRVSKGLINRRNDERAWCLKGVI